jgi:hypothetical protein
MLACGEVHNLMSSPLVVVTSDCCSSVTVCC